MKILFFAFIGMLAFFTTSCEHANASKAGIVNTSFTSQQKEKPDFVKAYSIGDSIEDFSLKNVDGKFVSLANFKDAKGFIVIFTCNSCPYAKMYEQRIIDLDKKYSHKKWQVIAINPNDPSVQEGDSYEKMQALAKEKEYGFPYLFDEGQVVYPKWGAARTPHAFIIQRTERGNILEYVGAIDDNARNANAVKVNYIDKTISSLESGEEPSPRTTKAIGCTIKTK